ncbi:MAG TPA: ABC transporter ATP-binding protein [Flavobacteriales bacterium]|nr:ABC transporter ATP-binding protein [Flavobacteriales bacterium]
MNPIISIKKLEKVYNTGGNRLRVLKGIDLDIMPGEFTAIMGSSGSGKSTMLNILGCLDKPTSGDYFIDGINVSQMKPDELADIRNTKIGFIFQSYNLLARTTALENVELPLLYNKKVGSRERRERAVEALRKVGLADRMHHRPNELSGGQQQRVSIARALVNDPVVILADEPTGNLDTLTSYQIIEQFQELNANGITIVMVTHEQDIAAFTKRNVVFKDGMIIKDIQTPNPQNASLLIKELPVAD